MNNRQKAGKLRANATSKRNSYERALPELVHLAPPSPTEGPKGDQPETPPALPEGPKADQPESPPALAEVQMAVKAAAEQWTRTLGDRAMLAWFGIAIATGFVAYVARVRGKDFWALLVALGILTACLILLWLWHRREGGFLSPLRAADGRLSTSYTQAAIWTVLVTFAFALFATRLSFGTLERGQFELAAKSFVPTYLLLLGGPFAAAALVRLNYDIRKDDGTIQKTEAYGAQLRDIVSDDSGRASLNDTQFLTFNVVAAATFIVLLAQNASSLPVLPSTLVGLTSLSALAYVTTKAVSDQRPVISSIVAATGLGGTTTISGIAVDTLVDIRGANFIVPGATDVEDLAQVRVRFGTAEVGVEGKRPDGSPNPTAQSVLVRIPKAVGAETTRVEVKVITAAGVESTPYQLALTTP